MSYGGSFFTRWRVRLGYPLAVAVLWFSRPTLPGILYGGLIGVVGLWVRAYAAGYLRKQEVLTISGPYAHTRNPLYLGSAILALGAGIATQSWVSMVILLLYFGLFYSVVMRREEKELLVNYRAAFAAYARAVPLFFPRLTPAKLTGDPSASFSLAQYKKNHEWQASIGFFLLLATLLAIWRLRL